MIAKIITAAAITLFFMPGIDALFAGTPGASRTSEIRWRQESKLARLIFPPG